MEFELKPAREQLNLATDRRSEDAANLLLNVPDPHSLREFNVKHTVALQYVTNLVKDHTHGTLAD